MRKEIQLNGELVLGMVRIAKAKTKIGGGWHAIELILQDENDEAKITCTLSYQASVELFKSLLPSIKTLHKSIYEKATTGKYKFNDEDIISIIKKEVKIK